MENKLKHLEFIQAVVARMNQNSFLVKGWAVTLVSALFALAADKADQTFVLVTYIPIPVFWFLDGFYLSRERLFRALYDHVAQLSPDAIDFSMKTSRFENKNNCISSVMFSQTVWPLYALLVLVPLLIMFVFPYCKHG